MDIPTLEAIIAQIPARFTAERLSVWRSQVVPRKRQWLVRVFLDRVADPASPEPEAPIGHIDCVTVSRFLAERIEAAFGEAFDCALEVSSPGAERALETPAEFDRFRGRLAQISYAADGAVRTERGTLGGLSADGRSLVFTPDGGPERAVPFADLRKARLAIG